MSYIYDSLNKLTAVNDEGDITEYSYGNEVNVLSKVLIRTSQMGKQKNKATDRYGQSVRMTYA